MPGPSTSPAYAIGHLRPAAPHPDLIAYVERIQATLDPYGGRFLTHGGRQEVREGAVPGALVLIAFPGLDAARAWYESPAYQALVPLRTRHIEGDVVLVEGVGPDYDPAAKAGSFRAALAAGGPPNPRAREGR
ncbi:DUF1330 domain-containing protein [Streptomyces sp. HNM0574]|uniref:DUF1330 domain-containing protein n=1 Tax=Streptomyces sp. HNM0574 TaxID=2714954 RepID=UPI00146F6847|nr:DUF1330 domain-containing protein [Streptomyces sp. HNM0574]NLU66705.1 DUF1330 domain-containing protein [Streptomyces sp. HNM0574]